MNTHKKPATATANRKLIINRERAKPIAIANADDEESAVTGEETNK